MCGIAGLLGLQFDQESRQKSLERMCDSIAHRGPDAFGFWSDNEAGVDLGHRRLAVLDLSEAGAQPMRSSDGRYTLIFNGEIYNHQKLRAELNALDEKLDWRGHSDTETLIVGITRWGLADTLRSANGMFALALWDARRQSLFLARDRMGEKPLYLASLKEGWAFASEPQALREVPGFVPDIDAQSVAEFLAKGVVPDRACIWKGVRKVRPGSILRITPQTAEVHEEDYDSFKDLLGTKHVRVKSISTEQAPIDAIEAVLSDVISSQMISDVPLGCFLSGGIDSSLVATLMQNIASGPVKTFSIGFDDLAYDESVHAERVAEHLGTDHRTFHLREEDALDIIPQLAKVYGEPFADSSQIPTLLLCHSARADVTVALTGDGGDEIFGGYNRHVMANSLWSRLKSIPRPLRRASRVLGRAVHKAGGGRSGVMRALARGVGLPATTLDKAGRLGEIVGEVSSLEGLYRGLTREMDDASYLLRLGAAEKIDDICLDIGGLAAEEWLMAMDTLDYLPSDILVKLDRAAMNASLETRAPYLDKRSVEAAWSLPLKALIENRKGKLVLREILFRYVPEVVFERPKQGFAVPMDRWLRGPLKLWAEELLSRERVEAQGVLAFDAVDSLWLAHQKEQANYGATLWSILMLQAWLQETAIISNLKHTTDI